MDAAIVAAIVAGIISLGAAGLDSATQFLMPKRHWRMERAREQWRSFDRLEKSVELARVGCDDLAEVLCQAKLAAQEGDDQALGRETFLWLNLSRERLIGRTDTVLQDWAALRPTLEPSSELVKEVEGHQDRPHIRNSVAVTHMRLAMLASLMGSNLTAPTDSLHSADCSNRMARIRDDCIEHHVTMEKRLSRFLCQLRLARDAKNATAEQSSNEM